MAKDFPSLVDSVPVDDQAFPLRRAPQGGSGTAPTREQLVITGACPHCGAPIYGYTSISLDAVPVATYACACWRRRGAIDQDMLTK